jgi:hypothetical protein
VVAAGGRGVGTGTSPCRNSAIKEQEITMAPTRAASLPAPILHARLEPKNPFRACVKSERSQGILGIPGLPLTVRETCGYLIVHYGEYEQRSIVTEEKSMEPVARASWPARTPSDRRGWQNDRRGKDTSSDPRSSPSGSSHPIVLS